MAAMLLLCAPNAAFSAKLIDPPQGENTPTAETIAVAEFAPAATVIVTSHGDLVAAIAGAVGPTVVELGGDINTTSTITIPLNADITLTGDHSLIAGGNFAVVTVHGDFTLDGPALTRTGTIGNSSQGVNVRDTGHFTMLDGVIHGHRGTGGGGVTVPIINFGWEEDWTPIERSGIFTMYGGVIRDNAAAGGGGGGVFSGGVFTMHGGTIKDNGETSSFGLGGGVNINDGSFVMYEGEISGNHTAGNNGGGVHVHMSATFVMNGGAITDNHSANGGGGVNANGSFTLNGGQITGNTAATDGGGIFHRGPFTANGGTLSGNTATRNGGGVFADGATVMHDGEIRSNTANGDAAGNGGGGVFVSNWGNFTMHGGQIADNTAVGDGGGLFFPVARRTGLIVGPDAIFNRNTAHNGALDYGLGAGLRDFPNIQWSGANSVLDSHLLNNYDINNGTVGVPGPLTVIFDLNGGAVDGASHNISLPITQGNQIGMHNVPTPTRGSYGLTGWQADGTGQILSPEDVAALVVTRPLTLVAAWIPEVGYHGSRQAYLIGTPEGQVRPLGDLTRAEAATILFRLLSDADRITYWEQSNPFPDVTPDNWFNNPVSTMANMDLFKGLDDGTFAPDQPITRGELATAMARFMDMTKETPLTADAFDDIGAHWAREYINHVAASGWAEGPYGLGSAFYPDQPITRAEVAAMLNRIFHRLPETADDLLPDMRIWPDNADVDEWYYLYIQAASNAYTYRQKADGIHETWVTIMPPRNWAALERPDSTPDSIFTEI